MPHFYPPPGRFTDSVALHMLKPGEKISRTANGETGSVDRSGCSREMDGCGIKYTVDGTPPSGISADYRNRPLVLDEPGSWVVCARLHNRYTGRMSLVATARYQVVGQICTLPDQIVQVPPGVRGEERMCVCIEYICVRVRVCAGGLPVKRFWLFLAIEDFGGEGFRG